MLYFIQFSTLLAYVVAANWSTYPSVSKTATVNGFADPIMNNLPKCAQSCVGFSTNNTPCPYWDTGCLCVMPQWSGQVAACFVSACSAASDLASATSAAYSLCSSAGANVWMMPASLSTELQKAASTTAGVVSSTPSSGSGTKPSSQSVAVTAPMTSSKGAGSVSGSSASYSKTIASTGSSASSTQSKSANAGSAGFQTKNIVTLFSVVLLSVLA